MVIWVTGLSGAGKTTLCQSLWRKLKPEMPELVILDGDAMRQAISFDLGYTEQDRVIQITRLQRLARLLSDQGIIVLVAALYSSPELLAWNREHMPRYVEIYVRASLETLKLRDKKGLYTGLMKNVVGLDIPWHTPVSPDFTFDADNPRSPDLLAQQVIDSTPGLIGSDQKA